MLIFKAATFLNSHDDLINKEEVHPITTHKDTHQNDLKPAIKKFKASKIVTKPKIEDQSKSRPVVREVLSIKSMTEDDSKGK